MDCYIFPYLFALILAAAEARHCPKYLKNGIISQDCRRFRREPCDYYCYSGCQKASPTIVCGRYNKWENADTACYCHGLRTTHRPDVTEHESDIRDPNKTLILAVAVSLGLAGGCFIIGCVTWGLCKWRKRRIQRENQEAAANQPVIYHDPATHAHVIPPTGRVWQYNQPTYYSHEANSQPLLAEARPAPSAPELPSDETGLGDRFGQATVDSYRQDQLPPYTDVVSKPSTFKS